MILLDDDLYAIAEMWVNALYLDINAYYQMKTVVKQIVSRREYLLIGLITDRLYRERYLEEVA